MKRSLVLTLALLVSSNTFAAGEVERERCSQEVKDSASIFQSLILKETFTTSAIMSVTDAFEIKNTFGATRLVFIVSLERETHYREIRVETDLNCKVISVGRHF